MSDEIGRIWADGMLRLAKDIVAERDAALAETAKLREAVLWTTAMFKYPDEGALEAFERVGDLFFRETGYLRPGKSCLIHDHDVRQAAFDEWFAGKLAAARALVEPSR